MYLLFDIGGTKIRIGISEDCTQIKKQIIFPTSPIFNSAFPLFKSYANQLHHGSFDAISGGLAGTLDQNKSTLIHSPNLPGWVQQPIKSSFEYSYQTRVFLENDAALGGLGEAVYGAGRGYNIVAYLTISTGVGGSKIVGGRIDEKAYGFEPGHMIIQEGKDLESFISGSALTDKYKKLPEEITDSMVWDEVADILSKGLNNIIMSWSPDAIVLGGSIMKSLSIDRITKYLVKNLKISSPLPKLELGTLGDLSGLYGAMAYIRQNLHF